MQNVIAQLNPEATRRIVLATHYDSRKYVAESEYLTNEFVPGANDSASGTAMLVELARVLSRFNMGDLGIDFVFFDGEEEVPKSYWLHRVSPRYLDTLKAVHDRFGLVMELPELEVI
jgi:hypothetical protein